MWEHYGSRIMGIFLRLFNETSGLTTDIFWWYISILSVEDYAPFVFIRSWALVVPYLCFRFPIFDRLVLGEYVSQVEGVHTCFNLAYVEHKMAFLLQLGKCTFFLKIWQLLTP